MCGETRTPRDMCTGNTIPGETRIPMTPNLEKAVAVARQSKAVQQQQGVVRGDPSVVDNVDLYKKQKNVENKGSNQNKQHSSHVPIPSPAQPP